MVLRCREDWWSIILAEDKGIGIKGWLSGAKPKSPIREKSNEKIVLDKLRIAVLPFDNISPDTKDEYFADGMTDELISTLSLISGLRVIARTSIMKYKGARKSIGEIGQELRTGTLLEGSVRKVENRLRATVQMIDAATEEHLWGQSFDRDFKDVFSIQSDIARNVAEILRVKLLPMESSQLQGNVTQSTEAYTEYLRGRFLWNKRSKEAIEKAIEHFQSAIKQDPSYAPAYAGLADCYTIAADWGYMPEKDAYQDAYRRAKKAALKALELNINLAEAHASLACILLVSWSWALAESEFKRAIELNPNYATARIWYSVLLATLGRPDEALVEAMKASELDPLSPAITSGLAWRLFESREYDSSIEQFKKVLEMQPDFPLALIGLAVADAKSSRCEEALIECQKNESLLQSDVSIKLYFAYVYALCGRKNEAERILREHLEDTDPQSGQLVKVAMVYSALGDKDKAMELLQEGYESHYSSLGSIRLFDFDNLRSDPRFIKLQKKMGLGE